MFISTNWIARHLDLTDVDLDGLAERFTLSVAELEGTERVGDLPHVVVGHVLEAELIEGTHLHRCQVDDGAGTRQVVCGAPNVAAGQRVALALPGARLGDLEIRQARVRGVDSAGMICSERELGLSDEHAGILVLDPDDPTLADHLAPGTPLSDLPGVRDTLWEIDNKSLTHRPDMWGHRGVARELAALLGRPLEPFEAVYPTPVVYTEDRPLTVTVDDPAACPRYTAVTLDGLAVAPSPLWLRMLLGRVGTRPISNAVDATNFVMLDLGNPLHAFDRRDLVGDTITVRRARDGERFVTLDEAEHTLTHADLLIADAERGVALAGVMGGRNSEIKPDTTRVVLESANFDPAVVRMTAQRLGLRTESSARFEKALDPALALDASRAFCSLLQDLAPGVRVTSALHDVAAPLPAPPPITLHPDRVRARLGLPTDALPDARIAEILTSLSFGVQPAARVQPAASAQAAGAFTVTVPSWRATKDISIEADLVEEVGRIYGYDNIPPAGPLVRLRRPHPNAKKTFERAARVHLSLASGFDEVMTYSFDFDPLLEKIGAVPAHRVLLRNAISAEMPALRTALGPNLLGVAQKNDRATDRVAVYELGRVFLPADTPGEIPVQPTTLGALVAERVPEGDPDARLFFELAGALAGLARAVERAPLTLAQGGVDRPWAHPVRQARLVLPGGDPADPAATVGYVAEVHPLTIQRLGLRKGAALFELDLDAWRATPTVHAQYAPPPRFPAVLRDFAVVVPLATPAAAVRDAIAGAETSPPGVIDRVEFQSVYYGPGLEEGTKSLAWSVAARLPDRTLTEAEAKAVEEAVWRAVAARVGGRPRA